MHSLSLWGEHTSLNNLIADIGYLERSPDEKEGTETEYRLGNCPICGLVMSCQLSCECSSSSGAGEMA